MTVTILVDGKRVSLPPALAGCGCPERAKGSECFVCKAFREMLEEKDAGLDDQS